MASPATEREQVALLREMDPIDVLESLPPSVFPVTAKLMLDQTSTNDNPHEKYRNPDFPVDVRIPSQTPYIPETTCYFDNPAERPPTQRNAWSTQNFLHDLEEIRDYFASETNASVERMYLSGLCVVEVPSRYLTSDEGEQVASPSLYSGNGDMTIAYFSKNSSLSAHNVREDLGDALPGETRTPVQLTRIDEVVAKPSMHGRGTQSKPGRRRYYTEREAEKSGKRDAVPAIWKVARATAASESVRPLTPQVSDLDQFLPSLSETDLVSSVTFTGTTEQQDRFYAEDVLSS